MNERPTYVPVHKLPTWLSSEDILAMIRDLAEQGVDKAVCWDMTQAIYGLVEKAHADAIERLEHHKDRENG